MNIKNIIGIVISLFTFIGILWSGFAYMNSFALADNVEKEFNKQNAKIKSTQLSIYEYRKENEIIFLQQRVYQKEDRLNNCINCDQERMNELKNDIRDTDLLLKSKEKELEQIRKTIDKIENNCEK